MASDYPVYCKALFNDYIYEKGVLHLKDIEKNNHAKINGFQIKLITSIYLYNLLNNYILFYPENSTINI